ncbi:MAG: GTP-dependent dephospho-CoA kinase [Archaeoglobaceae archaeon]|nr:GTP-dependent dephospho-CoA kinase [Archaeoglobaceae archaeon]MDK2876002.1 GTP-dependent dephospho-CoA kinase [Archaeoglobaceae archaeon]
MLRLPEKLRTELAKPYGKLYKDGERVLEKVSEIRDAKLVAVVGDFVAYCAFKVGIFPQIVIVDGKTLREKNLELDIPEDYERIEANNPAGFITSELVIAIEKAVKNAENGKRTLIFVMGEEDLAVMPLGIFMPPGSLILYGQPKEGVVAFMIDREKKFLILKLLKQMEVVEKSEELRKLEVV